MNKITKVNNYSRYYNRQGEPVTIDEYARTMETNRRVALTEVKPYLVSTVFLGLNHSFNENDPPLIFETMVFNRQRKEIDMRRYSTEKQAIRGHNAMVKRWRIEK
jgi:hypothetical protein